MPNYTYEIPSSLLTGFTLKQQTELRKIFDLAVETAVAEGGGGTTFKFIEEQGDAADSGTVLTDSEIVSSVASVDGDIVSSINSTLLGGLNNVLSGATSSGVLGGEDNAVELSTQSTIIGGSSNTISESENTSILGSQGSTTQGTTGAVIAAGSGCTATASRSLTIGDGAVGHRQWAVAVGGGKNVTGSLCQSTFMSGANATSDASPTEVYIGNVGVIQMLPNSVIGVTATVVATRTSDLASHCFVLTGLIKRSGPGLPVIVSQDVVTSDGDPALAAVTAGFDVPVSATGPRLVIQGLAATSIRWSAMVMICEHQIPA